MTAAEATLACGDQRRQASALLRECWQLDLPCDEPSARRVQFVVWPHDGPVAAAAALVVQSDGTAFVYPPAGDRSPPVIRSVYTQLQIAAQGCGADVVLALLSPPLQVLEPELLAQGFVRVSTVLSLRCHDIRPAQALATAHDAGPQNVRDAQRLAAIVRATYERSLSDPALAGRQDALAFVSHILSPEDAMSEAFVVQVDGVDAAVCLLCASRDGGSLTVRYLGVAPAFRGRGLGRRLLACSLVRMWRNTTEYASLDVDRDNIYARRVYEAVGFRPYAEAAEYLWQL